MAFGETDLNLDENNDRPGLDATIVVGWGRFINATALRKAVRIEDFLLEEGVISERLPKESMIDSGHIDDPAFSLGLRYSRSISWSTMPPS